MEIVEQLRGYRVSRPDLVHVFEAGRRHLDEQRFVSAHREAEGAGEVVDGCSSMRIVHLP